MTSMTIGKAARMAGVGVETIRFYERRGLIRQPPKPQDAGFRIYPDEAVERVRFIRQHGAGTKNIAKVILARRIGISRTKERAAVTPATVASQSSESSS